MPNIHKRFDDYENNEEEETEEGGTSSGPKWYELFQGEPTKFELPSEHTAVSHKIEAQAILEDEVKRYQTKLSKASKGSQRGWLYTVLQKGTQSDKMAAQILTIQESPVANLQALTSLVNLVKPSKKNQCLSVIDNLIELFLSDLLPVGLKLRKWEQHPFNQLPSLSGNSNDGRRQRLAAWLYESQLKEAYANLVTSLDALSKDTVDANREKAISAMFKLLSGHPELEDVLLMNLVNKLGDPVQKVVSRVIYCLTQLLRIHPNMKQIVLTQVEKLLFRPNIGLRTQYYAICFLSQFIYHDDDSEIAKNVIKIYFTFFKSCIKKGDMDSRMMGALLMGVKRAHPYARLDSNSLEEHIDTLYKLVHVSPFNISLHSLSLLEQVSLHAEDRFYSALYKKLFDSKLPQTTHQAMFINLMFKALSKDENNERIVSIIKRLLQVSLYLPVPFLIGILYMTSQLMNKKPKLRLFETKASQLARFDDDDSGDESYRDADKEEEETKGDKEDKKSLGWSFVDSQKKSKERNTVYKWDSRNPAYSGAESTAYFELILLAKHFHPTVSLYALKLLKNELIVYSGDPLADFTLLRFLDRFVFKNPKGSSTSTEELGDVKGPDPKLAQRKYYKPKGVRSLNVTSQSYLATEEGQIPVDELFLYRYLKEKDRHSVEDKADNDDDNESVASDEFNLMLDKMVGGKKEGGSQLDFMQDIGNNLKQGNNKNKRNNKKNDKDEEDSLSEMDDDDGEEAIDFDDDDDDEGFSDIDLEDDDDDNLDDIIDDDIESDKKKKSKALNKRGKKSQFKDLFAPAEEFSELLEEAGSSTAKLGMAHTFANPENAAPKQLAWEEKRDRWIRGSNKRKHKFRKTNKFKKKMKK